MSLISRKHNLSQSVGTNLDIIAILMENSDFLTFYHIYMKDPVNIKVAVLFLKLYEEIQKRFPKITKEEKLALLQRMICTNKYRDKLRETIQTFFCGNASLSLEDARSSDTNQNKNEQHILPINQLESNSL